MKNTQQNNDLKKASILARFYLLIVMNFFLIYVWCVYLQRQDISEVLSFVAQDSPGPLETWLYPQEPPVGVHYFGDLFQSLQQSRMASPYLPQNGKLVSQYPPLAHALLWPLTILNFDAAVYVGIVACFLILSASIFLLCRTIFNENSIFKTLVIPLCFLTSPSISILDRGNLVVISFILIVFTIKSEMRRSERSFFVGLSSGLKIYPVLFSLVYEDISKTRGVFSRIQGKLKTTLWAAIIAVGSNALVLAFIPGGFSRNLDSWLGATISNIPGSEDSRLKGSLSIAGLVENLVEFLSTNDEKKIDLNLLSLLLYLIPLLGITAILLLKCDLLSKWTVLTIAILLLPNFVATYQLIFLLIPLVLAINSINVSSNFEVIIATSIFLVLLPKNFVVGAYSLQTIINVPLLLFVLVYTVVSALGNRKLSTSNEIN